MALDIKLLVAASIIGVGVIFQIVGTATPAWMVVKEADSQTGLWKVCRGGDCEAVKLEEEDCKDDTDGRCSKTRSVQAFTVLGIMAGAAAALCAVASAVMDSKGKAMKYACGLAGVTSFVCVLIAVIVWADLGADRYKIDGIGYGYSFALSIIGGLAVLAGGILTVAVSRI